MGATGKEGAPLQPKMAKDPVERAAVKASWRIIGSLGLKLGKSARDKAYSGDIGLTDRRATVKPRQRRRKRTAAQP